MGVGSFIVRGKGNPESWASCSHGAGRRMSRTAAFRKITQQEFERSMQNVPFADTNEELRDEAPGAYKDLSVVMRNQKELVDVVHRLRPLINVKGMEKKPRGLIKSQQPNRRRPGEGGGGERGRGGAARSRHH
mmetsp:Transcript_21311/g.29853  ORF Transcript_21311/g.29853 Transcript_21311/m.29853 type:complete len:133 (-) Transcript_21311:116-514(-)